MRVLFVLGSGISRDADMPGVCEITRQVLSGEGVFLKTDGLFCIDSNDPNFALRRPRAERAIDFVGELHTIAERFHDAYTPDAHSDYEELGYLASQISDATVEYENPALLPLLEILHSSTAGGDLSDRANRAHEYIRDTTWRMLDKPIESVAHLGAVVDGCHEADEVDLYTLNHDLVIERALTDAGISFSDGFGREYGDLRIWSDFFGDASVRLAKLHGSISWWGFPIPEEAWRGYQTARVETSDVYHAHGPAGLPLELPHDMRPILLTGTFDKILRYESWIVPDLHVRFHEALRRSTRVVAIGYGFRDKAINSRIIGWLTRAPENRLVVVHGQPEDLRNRARGAIRRHWDGWLSRGQLRVVQAWVAEATWSDIAKELS